MDSPDVAVLKAVFEKYDPKKSGYLTRKQFIFLIDRLSKYVPELRGAQIKEAQSAFALFDKNSDKKLDFQEFSDWWASKDKFTFFSGEKSKLLRKAYVLYTKYAQKDGMTISEFSTMMEALGISHSDIDFDILDENDDGLLSFAEFCRWLNWF